MRVRLRLVGPPLLRLLGVHPAVFVALINNPSNIVHHHHHHQPYIARFVSRSYTVCPFFFFFSSPLSTPWRNYIHFPPLRQHFEGFLRGEKKKRTSSFSFLFFLYTHTLTHSGAGGGGTRWLLLLFLFLCASSSFLSSKRPTWPDPIQNLDFIFSSALAAAGMQRWQNV